MVSGSNQQVKPLDQWSSKWSSNFDSNPTKKKNKLDPLVPAWVLFLLSVFTFDSEGFRLKQFVCLLTHHNVAGKQTLCNFHNSVKLPL